MLIVSAVQYKPNLARSNADVRNNFRNLEPLIHDVWKTGSQLVVFPELFLTGYSFLNPIEAALASEKSDGPTFREMRSLATELKSYVAYGFVESHDNKLYNSCITLSPDGRVVLAYRKINLWGNDFLWATPGERKPGVFRTDFGVLSTIICRDIKLKIPDNIPRVAGSDPFYDSDKPDIIAACTNWGKGGFPSTSWMDFASNHKCTLVLANRWGLEENGNFSLDFSHGGSAIIEPDWKVHTSGLKFNDNCVVTAILETK